MKKRADDLEAKVSQFIRQTGRKAGHIGDPNDRQYDRKIEALVKRMDPVELATLLGQFDEDDEAAEVSHRPTSPELP